ncbi:hypothetical protein C8F04DRAFT_579156 [Mycena alexandri]|uniref:Uncharacterized protein n=1 Tax=Mycena alexandri TaxID=1745969 RepID=A0AAD6SV56_9AGAR|nr:hypothetical protein C8F04DRAFT_579156 [Mycena alexandri]
MFSGTGFRVDGGTFYNVNGDVNLQAHHQHLGIQNVHALTPLWLEDGGAGSQQRLAIEDRDTGPGLRPDVDGEGAQPASGLPRNLRHHTATRMRAPYDGSLRPHRAVISSNEAPGASHPTPEFYYPPPRTSTSDFPTMASDYHGTMQSTPVYTSDEQGYSTPYLNDPNSAIR